MNRVLHDPLSVPELIIYQSKGGICNATYIGKTSRNLSLRIDEHSEEGILSLNLKKFPIVKLLVNIVLICTVEYFALINFESFRLNEWDISPRYGSLSMIISLGTVVYVIFSPSKSFKVLRIIVSM